MAKQLNVDMRFTADTSKAKQAITDLEQSLQKLGHSSMPANAGIDPIQFEKASAAARELEFHLKNAFNAKTGNLDLSKLQSSLQQSKTSLKNLTSSFSSVGTVGQQAFTSLAKAIASADQPSLVLNTHLATMWTTLKNVARFQISSSIMHGLIGGVQQAYGYAQDLNKSLNNIRIVTGASTAEMARFAEQANKSARALSTTTLDYTDAALIYYQQGIRDQEEIASRVETTVKLANVSHQSAEEVSNQMTAIWNNFYDGSQSLEYYADVITALGAATASSSQEIAGGLEKFASVAQTVGLSYEYAASALATIVAQTRQSEDTVGTGLRTLFARFEGLKLGETLEDGVDLNKYSKALQAIGVNILDANGNLRQMDDILDDMGSKWDTLDQKQKVALAQTVGGVRQYTNLIALMDNWDKFQENLATAQGAEGALQQQAEIYAQSWEAARTRVKTAMQSIYSALIDENFFIGVDNTIEHMLNGISAFIKEFGGVKSILTAVLSFAAVMLADKIGPAISKIIQDIKILTGGAGKIYQNMQNEMSTLIDQEKNKKQTNASGKFISRSGAVTTEEEAVDLYSTGQQAELTGAQQLLTVKTKLSMVNDKLNATERMRAEIAISGIQSQIKANEDLAKEIDKVKKETLELIETEKKKKEEKQDKQKNMVSKQAGTIYGAGEQAVFDSIKKDYKALLDLSKEGEIKIDVGKIQQQLQDAQKVILEFRQKTVTDLLQTFAESSDISSIKAKLQEEFSQFDIGQFITLGEGTDPEVQAVQLQALRAGLSDIVGVSEEVEQAFMDALKVLQDGGNAEEALGNLQKVIREFPNDFEKIVASGDQFARILGVPSSAITEFTTLRNEIKELVEAEESLQPDQIEKFFKEIQKGAKAGKTAEQITKDIEGMFFKNKKIPPELENKIKELSDKFVKLQGQVKGTEKEINKFNPKPKVTGIQAITSFAGALGQVQTALRAVTSLTETWNNQDLTFGEKLMSSFMSISMLVPSVIGSFSGFGTVISFVTGKVAENSAAWAINGLAQMANGATIDAAAAARIRLQLAQDLISTGLDGENAALLANTAATLASTGALAGKSAENIKAALTEEIKNKLIDQGATGELSEAMALNIETLAEKLSVQGKKLSIAARLKHIATIIAEKATMIATNPVYAAMAVVIMAVVTALTLLHLASEKRKKDAENAAKEAEIATENAKKLQEEYSKVKTLLDAYEDLYEKYKETGEGKDDLNDKARDLAEALGMENAELLIQAGLYDEILSKGKDWAAQQAVQANQAAFTAQTEASQAVQAAIEMNEGNGRQYTGSTSGNNYVLQLENGGGTGAALNDEKITIEAMEAVAAKYADQGVSIEAAGGGEYNIIVPNTPEGMALLRQVTTDIQAETISRGGGSDSELFQGAANFLADQEEVYSKLEDANKLVADNDYLAGLTIPDKAISSVEEYTQAREDLNAQLLSQYGDKLTDKQRDDIVDTALSRNENTQDYWLMFEAMEKMGLNTQSEMDDFISHWEAWTPEEKDMVLGIIAKSKNPISVDQVIEGLENLKSAGLDYEALSDNIEVLNTLIGLIDSGKATTEDYLNLYRANPEFFKKMGVGSEFELQMLPPDALRRLAVQQKNITQQSQQDIVQSETQRREELPKEVEGAKQERDKWEKTYQNNARQQAAVDALQNHNVFGLENTVNTSFGDYSEQELADLYSAIGLTHLYQQVQRGETDENVFLDQAHALGISISSGDNFYESDYYRRYNTLLRERTHQETSLGQFDQNGMPQEMLDAAIHRMNLLEEQSGMNWDDLTNVAIQSNIARSYNISKGNYEQANEQYTALKEEQDKLNGHLEDLKQTPEEWLEDFQNKVTLNGFDYTEITEYASYLREAGIITQDLTESTEDFMQRSLELAFRQKQVDKGLQELNETSSDYYALLDNNSQGTDEYRQSLKKMQNGVMDLIGATDSENFTGTIFDEEFFTQHQEIIEKAAEGDIEAIEAVQTAAAHQVAAHLIDPEAIDDDGVQVLSKVDTLIDDMQAAIPDDIEIGMSIGEINGMEPYLNDLQAMLDAGELTAEQVNAVLESIGFDPQIDYIPIEAVQDSTAWVNGEQEVDFGGGKVKITQEAYNTAVMEGKTSIPVINAKATTSTGAPKKSASKGGGGGGGGGGKNKNKEKKNPTDEKDRYHTITQKIQDATDAYNELSKAEDRAFGKERIKAMEGITDNLKLQIELQKQYLDEIRNYLEGDRAAVEALGATFDANGVITNYDDLIAELIAKYNEGVDAFNNGGLDEDAFKEQYEEPFNDAKEAISQYVETINLLQSEELNLIDKQNELADQFREIAAYKLELHIDFDEDELKYLDFLLEMLGEDAEIAADRLAILGDKFNTSKDEVSAYATAIQDLLRLRGFSDEDVAAFIRGELTAEDLESRGFTSDDIDKLREYRDAIQENTQAMKELSDEIEQAFLDTLDDLNDKVTDAADRFEHFTNMFEHFKNVVDIVGQDALGMSAETMKLIAKSAKENAIEMVKAAKTQLDSLTQVRQQAQAQLDAAYEAQKNATTAEEKLRAQESIRYWSETIEEVTNRVNEAQENLNEKLEEALEGIKDAYTAMVEQATKEFEKQITGLAGSLENLRNNFDRQKETQELYIPAYEKIYELTKLTRDIGNSINDTDNLWSKRELAKLQDEINDKMADGVELTEHDVEELRKRYELKLAEAALEEARDSKRTVRMSRDNEGNWSYVYTADEDDVAAAEQNYEDKLYQYQQMNYEYIQELQDKIIQAEQDMTDQINDLDVTKFASKEAYLDAVNRIIDATRAKEQQYKDQLAQTLEQQNTLYEDDWARYNERTGYRMARDDQWVDNWNETILAQETGFETLEDMFDELTGAIGGPEEPGTYVGDITDAYAEMQASNERALNAAGTSMQTYESDVRSAISGIGEEMDETQTRVEEFAESLNESMEAVTDYISEWKNSYGEAVLAITGFNQDLYNSCQKLITALQGTFAANADFEAALHEQSEKEAEKLGSSTRGGEGGSEGELSGSGTAQPGAPGGGGDEYTYGKIKWNYNETQHWKEQEYTSKSGGWSGVYEISGTRGTHTPNKTTGKCTSCGKYNRNWIAERPDSGGKTTPYEQKDIQGDITPASIEEPTPMTIDENSPELIARTKNDTIVKSETRTESLYPNFIWAGGLQHIYAYKIDETYEINYQNGQEFDRRVIKQIKTPMKGYCNIQITSNNTISGYVVQEGKCSGCGHVYHRGKYISSMEWGQWESSYKTGGYTGTWGPETNSSNSSFSAWDAISGRTGMYTGSWNGADVEANGRLAFLHQKELVLNADDTKNFLSAVDMVRQISQTIDLQAASRSNWNFLLPGILGKEPDTLDQNVHIEAHFPNVTSHSEIEEAFTNLVGKASQFANR